ncbi:unnamed protein product [Symbiodinium sp. CCMP2592]|nr:unnamed protein product [Symbiodinium sp. CCMP2592]CAE7353616.1 unnamed protein product [Symbiodinium sp. CCMP2592]CAE7839499.1 unnamed protein product [Symbiodinium sp. CCMP2592]
MTTMSLPPLDDHVAAGTELTGMVEMLAKHFFGLETEDTVAVDATQEAKIASVLKWAGQVLGRSMADGVAHLTEAIAAAQAAGTILNPYQSQHLLAPVVSAINETMTKLREFKYETDQTKEKRASVYKQGEAMVLKLKQQLEQGHLTEDEMNRRCRAVTVWQSTKDSALDVKLGELEAEVCTRVEDASNLILDVWHKHVSKSGAEHMVAIPEHDEIMMDADQDLTDEAIMLPMALQLRGGQSLAASAASQALPRPSGLMSRGSAEDLAREAEEYKRLRKAGKGGWASTVKTKTKGVGDKMTELESLKGQLDEKPAHMSEPLRKGYLDELELHRTSLSTALETLQADDLDEAPEKQQACLEALAATMKAYQDAASMIKKKVGIWAPAPILCEARVVTAWLADVVTGLIEDEDYQTEDFRMLAQCMHFLGELMNTIEQSPRYLESLSIQSINRCTDAAMAAYLSLAAKGASDGTGFFLIRPKLHVPLPIIYY